MNSIILGIGTSSGSGVSAACANNSSNSSSSPPNQQSSNQHLPKNSSASNQNDTKDGQTSPSKTTHSLSKIQKSPSDSHSSKNETEKVRSGKSRNKEGSRYFRFLNLTSSSVSRTARVQINHFTEFFHFPCVLSFYFLTFLLNTTLLIPPPSKLLRN